MQEQNQALEKDLEITQTLKLAEKKKNSMTNVNVAKNLKENMNKMETILLVGISLEKTNLIYSDRSQGQR